MEDLTVPSPQMHDPERSSVFVGPFGLRAGWSLLIYFGIIAAMALGLYAVQKHRHPKPAATAAHGTATAGATQNAPAPKAKENKPAPVLQSLLGEGVVFLFILLLSWLMAFIERRRLGVFGLGGARPLARFGMGALWGLLALSLLVGMLRAFHLLAFDAQLDHGADIVKWGALLFVLFLCVGLFEEYLFRGYLQYTLTRGFVGLGRKISESRARTAAFWIAAVITSGLFFFVHTTNGGENALGLTAVFFAGITFIVALWRTGSLWWAIGFHTTWDWAQSFLYGVPDSGGLIQGRLFATHATGNTMLSGGTAGPEGSLLVLPVLLLVIVVLFFTHPSPQPPLEPKSRHRGQDVAPVPSEAPSTF